MEVFRCFSDFHLKCLQHPISRVSDSAGICKWITDCLEYLPLLNPEETKEFENWLSQYICHVNCYSGVRTPLHAACEPFSFPFGLRYRPELVRMLLRAGADPSAADGEGWSPLHFLLQPIFPWHSDISACVHLLLDTGAHMDQLNSDGCTPMFWGKSHKSQLDEEGRPDQNLDAILKSSLPFSLGCFSAQVIVRNKIPFDKLPTDLRNFVVQHGGQM